MSSVIKVKVDYRGPTNVTPVRLPALLTKHGILLSLLQYQSETTRSPSWREKLNLTVRLLLDFISQCGIPFSSPTEILKGFRSALTHGTINEYLEDPTELYWRARNDIAASELVNMLSDYTDWLTRQPGHSGIQMNPIREATSHEEYLNWCAYHNKKDRTLLKHLISADEAAVNRSIREIRRQENSSVVVDEVKRFPEESFNSLIDKGFVRATVKSNKPNEIIDYKSQSMTLLMHYGGVRKSELFHLYLDDIDIDTSRMEAVVRIHHPSLGKVRNSRYSNREEYLLKKFRMKPRHKLIKSETLHAGWKAPAINSEKFFEVQFYPPSKAQEFLLAFKNYLIYQRVEPNGLGHPYAFTNSAGRPETIKNYQRLHKAAVERIGLSRGKYFGTTEHGHRHAYGYRLADVGFSALEIQKSMRHKSIESSQVYTQSSDSDLRNKMRAIESKMKNAQSPEKCTTLDNAKNDQPYLDSAAFPPDPLF